MRRPRRLFPVLLGSTIITAHFLIQITGLEFTTATNTGWIISITPLVMALLAWLLLGEKLRRGTVAGIAIATLGILLLVSRGRLVDLDWLRSIGDWQISTNSSTGWMTQASRVPLSKKSFRRSVISEGLFEGEMTSTAKSGAP